MEPFVSIVMRCPTCNARFQPAGSLEAGNLDVRCPRCTRPRRRRRRESGRGTAPSAGYVADAFADRDAARVWISAVIATAIVISLILAVAFSIGVVRVTDSVRAATSTTKPANREPPGDVQWTEPPAPGGFNPGGGIPPSGPPRRHSPQLPGGATPDNDEPVFPPSRSRDKDPDDEAPKKPAVRDS